MGKTWWIYLVIAICFLLSMFFSSADMVISVVDKDKLRKEAEKGNKSAKLALFHANNYEFSISSILFGNNVVNIFISSLVTILGATYNKDWGALVATIILTILIIIFAEFLPKAFSKRFSYPLAKIYAYPISVFQVITFIFVWPISKLFVLVSKLFKKRSIEEDEVDEDELNEMIDTLEENKELDEEEADIVRGAIDITDTQAFEIMTPRVDVYAIEKDADINEIIKQGDIFKHSRIPIYEGTIDNIIGILPIKSIAKAVYSHQNINISALSYKPLRVPRNRNIIDLLNEFKSSKVHIAVVIDEYGGTDGIVTMEDILEEIVGDIFDETDEVEEEYIDQGNGTYIVDGSMNIDDFFDLIEYKKEFDTDYSTVGGFCQEMLDRFAQNNDEFIFENRYKCKVLQASEFTVEKLKVIDLNFEIENENKDE
ncbi:MAG: hemolysin family protein [Bacilli bacterium]|nr:hemolysin family protein [Bacilli bacterium]